MRYLVQLLTIGIAAGLGLAIGFFWRGTTERATDPLARPGVLLMTAKDSRKSGFVPLRRGPITESSEDSVLTQQLRRHLSTSSRVTRWLYWLEGIEKASLPDFPRLASLANGDPTATRLVASRWVKLDLRHLFETLASAPERTAFPADELADVLFRELAHRDPDAAITALQGTNRFGTREMWRFNVAGYLIEKDPERGLRALSEWGIGNFAPRMNGVAKWAAADPRHATEVVLTYPAGYTSHLAIETIASEWTKADPVAALEFSSSKSGSLATALASTALKHWASRNIEPAADWLANADSITRQRLSPAFIEAWAKTDSSAALAWCEANLTGSSLSQTVGSILNGIAQKDLSAAADFVTHMKLSAARAEGAAAVARNWFPTWRSGKPVPAAAIAWMGRLDANSARRALEQVQWKWSNNDPQGMAAYVATVGGDFVPTSADLNVARSLARQNPEAAFTWASRLPPERSLAAGREAFSEWRHAQPELALKWLNALPTSDRRRNIFQ